MSDYLPPIAAVLIPNIGGFLSGYSTRDEVRGVSGKSTWYQALKKPKLQPPSWLFAPVWTGLYCSMGYASYMVWRDGGDKALLPLACYGTQLAINFAWSPIFFKMHKLGLATLTIGTLWGAIVATIITFHDVNPTAAHMLLPYLGWTSFASYLTFSMWRNNKDRTD